MAQERPRNTDRNIQDLLECPICSHEYNGTSITQCGHRFCTHCILRALENKEECPMCRAHVTDRSLISDTVFDELIVKIHELPTTNGNNASNNTGQGGTIPVEAISDILQSILPRRDQDMRERTDALIVMKDQEITRLSDRVQTQTTELDRLHDDVTRIRTQLQREQEKSRDLEESLERKRSRKRELKDEVQRLHGDLAAAMATSSTYEGDRNKLEGQLHIKVGEVQKLTDSLEEMKKEINSLKEKIAKTSDTLKITQSKLETSENTNVQLKVKLQSHVEENLILKGELVRTKEEMARLRLQIQNLILYERMCQQKDAEMQDLRQNTLPEKDNMIAELQRRVQSLIEEVTVLRQTSIPMSEHTEKLTAELHESIEQLKTYYDTEYTTKLQTLEKNNETLQNQLRMLQTELDQRVDDTDRLQTAARTYKTLIAENSQLHEKVKKAEKDTKRLQQELCLVEKRNQDTQHNYQMLQNKFQFLQMRKD